jgi:hypothetical protein
MASLPAQKKGRFSCLAAIGNESISTIFRACFLAFYTGYCAAKNRTANYKALRFAGNEGQKSQHYAADPSA